MDSYSGRSIGHDRVLDQLGAYVFLRPAPAPALTDKDLRQALTVSLSQSPFLSLISRTRRFARRCGSWAARRRAGQYGARA
jgi:hypothetical protein